MQSTSSGQLSTTVCRSAVRTGHAFVDELAELYAQQFHDGRWGDAGLSYEPTRHASANAPDDATANASAASTPSFYEPSLDTTATSECCP